MNTGILKRVMWRVLPAAVTERDSACVDDDDDNNNNNIYLLQLGCYPVAVVILHVYKTWNWLLLNLSREGYMRSM